VSVGIVAVALARAVGADLSVVELAVYESSDYAQSLAMEDRGPASSIAFTPVRCRLCDAMDTWILGKTAHFDDVYGWSVWTARRYTSVA
jgi:hypothetical protein